MADGEILKNYKETIEEALYENFPDFNITVFADLKEDFELPAIVINKPVLEPKDLTLQKTAHIRMTATSSAFVIYSAADEDNNLDCIQKAADLTKFIHLSRFGQSTPAKVTLVEPVLEQGLEEYFIQRIDFEQIIEI